MVRNILRTGKKARPKTAVRGKRYRCAVCHKRSPKPVKTSAPWYCPKCLEEMKQSAHEPMETEQATTLS
jgi:ribosomal protein L37AE/L43A